MSLLTGRREAARRDCAALSISGCADELGTSSSGTLRLSEGTPQKGQPEAPSKKCSGKGPLFPFVDHLGHRSDSLVATARLNNQIASTNTVDKHWHRYAAVSPCVPEAPHVMWTPFSITEDQPALDPAEWQEPMDASTIPQRAGSPRSLVTPIDGHNMPEFPPEIINLIFEELKDQGAGLFIDLDRNITSKDIVGPIPFPEGRKVLATTVCLVNRAFQSHAAPMIWEYLVVRSQADLVQLSQLSQDGKHESLTVLVRRLDLQIKGQYNRRLLCGLLSRLPNLRILVFANVISQGLGWPLYHITQAVIEVIAESCRGLDSLHFRSLSEQPTLLGLAHIARNCQHIRVLQIAAIDPVEAFFASTSNPLPCFKALQHLSLGSGPDYYSPMCVPTFESHNFKLLIHILGRSSVAQLFPSLKAVHLMGEVEWGAPFVLATRGMIQKALCGSSWRVGLNGHALALSGFRVLKTLVIVIEAFVASLPVGLDAVESVEVIQPRVLLNSQELHSRTNMLLSLLLESGWPSLKRITLYLSARRCSVRADWHEHYGRPFQAKGINFVVERSA